MNDAWFWDSNQPLKAFVPLWDGSTAATVVKLPMKLVSEPNGDLKIEISLPPHVGDSHG